MPFKNSATHYGAVSRSLHWSVFLLFACQYVGAKIMTHVARDKTLFGAHRYLPHHVPAREQPASRQMPPPPPKEPSPPAVEVGFPSGRTLASILAEHRIVVPECLHHRVANIDITEAQALVATRNFARMEERVATISRELAQGTIPGE